MDVALMVVGAHTGEKLHAHITAAAKAGTVVLVEPVPWLFSQLCQTVGSLPQVLCINCCIAPTTGTLAFFAPRPNAGAVDQLGSLRRDHAARHDPALGEQIEEIPVQALTFRDFLAQFDINRIDILLTDTEGSDADILADFPFDRLMPNQIVFEFKHADGTFNIGRKLGRLLIRLDELGYDMQIADVENCIATRRQAR